MNNPDQVFNPSNYHSSSIKVRTRVIEDTNKYVEAMCICLARENKKRYEAGEKPVKVFNYVVNVFEEAVIELYLHKNNYNVSAVSRELDLNRGTLQKLMRGFKELYEGANDD